MEKFIKLALSFQFLFFCSFYVQAAEPRNPHTYTYLGISDIDSLDPAWAYDASSCFVILNCYEPLLTYKKGSITELSPLIASQVPSRANGLISSDGLTYTFPIREGVKFHDGALLTPEDVRYSILRFMLKDRTGGPSSLLLEPITGHLTTRQDGKPLDRVFHEADKAVLVKGKNIVIRLKEPFPAILPILAQWAPVVSKKWAALHGDWDGREKTWKRYNNPRKEDSYFADHVNGTGPFGLEGWDKARREIVLLRNENYWRQPAKLERIMIKGVDEFATRKLMLMAGDADNIWADRSVFRLLHNLPEIEVIDDLPALNMDPVVLFTFDISTTANRNVGSGRLDGKGIPPDFFSDIDVRKAFAYSIDYQAYIRDVAGGKAIQAGGCIPKGFAGYNPGQKKYKFDLKKAKKHFKRAWNGEVWKKGFHFTIASNFGNISRDTICRMIKKNVESLNPKFRIDTRGIQWSTYLDAATKHKLPIFITGWEPDYPDPHNFAFHFLHSRGTLPNLQRYSNTEMDALVRQGSQETNLKKRGEIYERLIRLAYEEVPQIYICHANAYRVQRTWVKGWYYNPIFPDSPYGSDFYTIYKN